MLKKLSYLMPLLFFPLVSFAECSSYVSIFGGGGYSNYGSVTQRGTAFFPEASGGPLAVNATGNAKNKSAWIIGINTGYRWNAWSLNARGNSWCVSPIAELEGYFLFGDFNAKVTDLNNRLQHHTFRDFFNIKTGVILVNSVWSFRNPCLCAEPYVGVGAGAARVRLFNGDSLQTVPPEPGINHFNSNNNDSNWTFAAQAKAGLRFEATKTIRVYAEYRYVYLSPTSYHFGSTQYPTHVATSKWNMQLGTMSYNLGCVGLEYVL